MSNPVNPIQSGGSSSSSVFLPKTSFSMKANLAEKENDWLQWWQLIGLYAKQRYVRKGRPLFVLHDGPPYANGHIHLGHGMNYVLKDAVNRWAFLKGYDICFVPGWDCHGLPIEAKVEEGYREKGQDKKQFSLVDFRKDCRVFAQYWVDAQKKDFQRLGITGDWDNTYQTSDFSFENAIVGEFFKLVNRGLVYRALKPVLWSVSEKTALAEAETEYKELTSHAIYVRFPIKNNQYPEFQHCYGVIWTTTPWSLMGNRAIAYKDCTDYTIIEVSGLLPMDGKHVSLGEKFLLASDCIAHFCHTVGISDYRVVKIIHASLLQGLSCFHPLHKAGYDFDVPFLPGEHVTTESGTGLVHTAPSHGLEDFVVGQNFSLEIPNTVSEEGTFTEEIPLFAGQNIWQAYPNIRDALIKYGMLVHEAEYVHSYPHSWRSKKPLIYRAMPQWFIALDDGHQLRDKSLEAIKKVRWIPEASENRITSMVESRPDWCISRQRSWGVPLPLFLHIETGAILKDPIVFQRIEERIAQEGCDFWFTESAFEVLGKEYSPKDWIKVVDILDVWFESGVTHMAVLKRQIPSSQILPTHWPADLYLEGSDQHRGFFQASLLTSVALEGEAPYRCVVTHGFLLDEKNRKMSKSLGNTFAPKEIIQTLGADILRLWAAHEDYKKDMSIGPTILKRVEDLYRRFRNTFRYLLGGLHDFSVEEIVSVSEMPVLERWIHHRLAVLEKELKESLKNYEFQNIIKILHLFCSVDLSSFYFDISKDVLYCDPQNSHQRKAVRTTFFHILVLLTHWLAPVLCFTCEEVWHAFGKDILGLTSVDTPFGEKEEDAWKNKENKSISSLWAYWFEWAGESLEGSFPFSRPWSIHLNLLPGVPDSWVDPETEKLLSQVKALRGVVTSAIEGMRHRKQIHSSLEAFPILYIADESLTSQPFLMSYLQEKFADLCLSSGAKICVVPLEELPEDGYCQEGQPKVRVVVEKAKGEKCSRCWRILQEVSENNDLFCHRCQNVMGSMAMEKS